MQYCKMNRTALLSDTGERMNGLALSLSGMCHASWHFQRSMARPSPQLRVESLAGLGLVTFDRR